MFDLAISPDGRWAATGSREESPAGRQVNVQDAATGDVVADAPAGAHWPSAPTADGSASALAGRYRFLRNGSWTPGSEISHGVEYGLRPLAFHPGGRCAALLDSSGSIVRLVEVETGRVLAALEVPDPSGIHFLTFSPDGRFLAVSVDQRVHLWDLALIRRRLDKPRARGGPPRHLRR